MQVIWGKVRQYKTWILSVVLLALAATGGTVYYQGKNAAPVTAGTTMTVVRGDIQSVVSATGTISAMDSVEISSRVTGLLTNVTVKENDMVTAGQVLAVLDDTTLKAQVAQYRSQLENYATIYERSKTLAAIGALSVQQLDADRTNYLVAQSTYDNYISQLDYYVIKTPIDGMVIGKPTPAGQTVAQGISTPQVIMTIADMSKMQIKVLVDETDIGRVKMGQDVSFTVDAYTDKTFSGKVTSISRSATTSSNVIYYPVYVDVAASEGLLYPTMTARVTINVGESKNVLVVPLSAIKEEKGQKYVRSIANGQMQNIPVRTGLVNDENVEIISGLTEGVQIVLPTIKTSTTSTSTTKNQGPPPPI